MFRETDPGTIRVTLVGVYLIKKQKSNAVLGYRQRGTHEYGFMTHTVMNGSTLIDIIHRKVENVISQSQI